MTSIKTKKATKAQAVSLLRKMRKTLSRKAAWGKGANAKNSDGHIVDPAHDTAVQFCLQGAALNALGTKMATPVFDRALAEIGKTVYVGKSKDEMEDYNFIDEAITFNDMDRTTHQALLGAIDRTVNRLVKSK